MTSGDWSALLLTLGTALCSTLLITPFGMALGWLLARRDWPGKSIVETICSLPLVLPPVATGLILLSLLGRRGWIGRWSESIGLDFVFSWKGVVVAMAVMSFPLLFRHVRLAIEGVNPRMEQVARTLGASAWETFWSVTFPLSARGLCSGMAWALARALGEFGATVLVAGNIPGRTTTLSVAIYSSILQGDQAHAYGLLVISALLGFGIIFASNLLSSRS